MSLIHCQGCGETHDSDRTCARTPLEAPTGSARLNRRIRLCQAISVLVGIEAKVVVEAVAAQMPDASVFWDVTDRQVEIVGDEFEVIIRERQRQSPNAQPLSRGEGSQGKETSR